MKQDNVLQVTEVSTTAYNASVNDLMHSFRDLTRSINKIDDWFKTESTYLILLFNSVLKEYA